MLTAKMYSAKKEQREQYLEDQRKRGPCATLGKYGPYPDEVTGTQNDADLQDIITRKRQIGRQETTGKITKRGKNKPLFFVGNG